VIAARYEVESVADPVWSTLRELERAGIAPEVVVVDDASGTPGHSGA
jgi:hypothetical protein